MPWSPEDATRFKKNLSGNQKRKWSSVANEILAKTGDEKKAVRAANGVTRESIQRRMKNRTNIGTGKAE